MAKLASDPPAVQDTATRTDAKGIGPWPYVAAAAGPLADLGTSLDAFSRGAVESNPVFGGAHPEKALIATKAAQAVLYPLLMRQLVKSGHPDVAKWLGYSMGGMGAGLAAHNAMVAR